MYIQVVTPHDRCVILPKVLEEISPMPNPIPIPMNTSPSEKKSNFLTVLGPANSIKVLQYSIEGETDQNGFPLKNHRRSKVINFDLIYD